jgi:hypothetical protein
MSHTSISSTTEKPEGLESADNGNEKGDIEAEKDQTTPPEDVTEYPKGFRLAMVILALVLSVFLVALDMASSNLSIRILLPTDMPQTIVATAIPHITDEFHSLDQIGWYGSAFFLTFASFQSTWGKVSKFFPLKASFMLAIAIFELGSLICGERKTIFVLKRELIPHRRSCSE